MKFKIPVTPDAADKASMKLGEEVTCREWKRAAMVYARTEPGTPGTSRSATSDRISFTKYSERGIHGLCSKTTVRRYWQAWDNAITEGLAEPVSLGDEVELPDAEWADYYNPPLSEAIPPYANGGGEPDNYLVERELEFSVGAPTGTQELGECPPRASVIENNAEAPYVPPTPMPRPIQESESEEEEEEEEEEDVDTDYFNETIFNIYLDSLRSSAQNVFKTIDGVTFRGDAEKTLAIVEQVREALTEIENAINHSKENEEA